MRRKLVKQGKGALTVSLPSKWTKLHNLKAGKEITFREDDQTLIIDTKEDEDIKKTSILLEPDTPETYRSLIGGLYRGGYDEVRVKFSDPNNISELQAAVNSLYGYEIFEISNNTCFIKNIYKGTATEIKSHILRMIHTIKTMQDIILVDLGKNKSDNEIKELRNNILKQRDIIIRLIHKQKLVSNRHLPYYTISLSLWSVARNYYILHNNLRIKPLRHDMLLIKDTIEYFSKSFEKLKLNVPDFVARNERYKMIRKEAISLMHNKPSIIASHCLNIIISIQLADSSLYLLNHKD